MVTSVAKPVDKNNKKEKKQDKGGGGGGGSKEVSITEVILFTHRTNTETFITSQFVTNSKSDPHFLSHSFLTLIVFFSPPFLSAPAEPVARIHPRAPQPLRGAEEGERRPAGNESPRQQAHHRGAARRTEGGGQGLAHHTVPAGL